ncbi:MAG: DUF3048 domain-containing protein, partial [Firmicutes bacterium]|nr:DUF3048 domain-containing protein [Bacillota bacterium]
MFLSKFWPNKPWLRILVMALPIVIILTAISTVVIYNSGEGDVPYTPAFVEHPPTEPDPPTELPAFPPPPIIGPYQTLRWDFYYDEPIDTRPRSLLTGLPIEEEYLYRRPIAVVINNLRPAWPQSGIVSADVIYEVLAEGEVTRLVGIFQS